jgi:hypothetical protein
MNQPPLSKLDPQLAQEASDLVFEIMVTVQAAQPPDIRCIAVSAGLPLDRFHRVLQQVLGREDGRVHRFITGSAIYRIPAPDNELYGYDKAIDERHKRVRDLLPGPGARAVYQYGAEGCGEHAIEVKRAFRMAAETR